jgi:adenine-specific DNA methylase
MYAPRKLIEHLIPLAEISEALARAKSIRHGHLSTDYIWWARRSLAATRAIAFAAQLHLQRRHRVARAAVAAGQVRRRDR